MKLAAILLLASVASAQTVKLKDRIIRREDGTVVRVTCAKVDGQQICDHDPQIISPKELKAKKIKITEDRQAAAKWNQRK